MTFRVGQKVVCVDDTPSFGRAMPIKKGDVYTVTRTGLSSAWDGGARPCITVAEVDGWPLWQHRFRPVVERKTDISIFTELLAPAKRETVDA